LKVISAFPVSIFSQFRRSFGMNVVRLARRGMGLGS
jgi:hypothetical protein